MTAPQGVFPCQDSVHEFDLGLSKLVYPLVDKKIPTVYMALETLTGRYITGRQPAKLLTVYPVSIGHHWRLIKGTHLRFSPRMVFLNLMESYEIWFAYN
jgi:hypothetical protein